MVIFALLIFPLTLLALLLAMERVERLLVTTGHPSGDHVPPAPAPVTSPPAPHTAAEPRRTVAAVRLLPGQSG